MEEKINKNKIIFTVIIILLILLIGILIYIIYDKNKDVKINQNNDNQENSYEELSIESDFIKNLYSYSNIQCEIERKIYYENDKFIISDMDNDYKLIIPATYLYNNYIVDEGQNNYKISVEKYKEIVEKIFGKINYDMKNTTKIGPPSVYFDKEPNTVNISLAAGCPIGQFGYLREIVAARKYDDRIEIAEKHLFKNYEVCDSSTSKLCMNYYDEYFDINDKNAPKNKIGYDYYDTYDKYFEIDTKETIKKYADVIPTYRFTYKKDAKENYYFYSVEKLK